MHLFLLSAAVGDFIAAIQIISYSIIIMYYYMSHANVIQSKKI